MQLLDGTVLPISSGDLNQIKQRGQQGPENNLTTVQGLDIGNNAPEVNNVSGPLVTSNYALVVTGVIIALVLMAWAIRHEKTKLNPQIMDIGVLNFISSTLMVLVGFTVGKTWAANVKSPYLLPLANLFKAV